MPECYACGSEQIKVWIDDLVHHYQANNQEQIWSYRLMECAGCGLGFIDPMPDVELLKTFYPSTYACYAAEPVYEPSKESQKYKLARMRFPDLKQEKGSLGSLLKRSVSIASEWVSGKTITYSLGVPLRLTQDAMILEIGYGSGHWLYNMAAWGYKNLYGYDIDANPTSTEKLRAVGVHLPTDILTNYKDFVGSFDCIRLEHVFEHLLNPLEMLEICRSLLKPDGFLVMTYPCKTSLSRLISSRYWGPLDPPVHLYHYTPKSTKLVLQKADFTLLGSKPFSVTEQLIGTINNCLTARKINDFSLIGRTLRLLAPVYRMLGVITGTGDFMTVVAKPRA
jgi:SAM-dependent methyltransferase